MKNLSEMMKIFYIGSSTEYIQLSSLWTKYVKLCGILLINEVLVFKVKDKIYWDWNQEYLPFSSIG